MKSLEVSHTYDLSLQSAERIDSTVFNACEAELQSRSTSDCDGGGDDGGIDTFGTFGSAGTLGGTARSLGTAGCCC